MGTEAEPITARDATEDALLSGMMDQLGVGVALVAADGLICYQNRLFGAWLGRHKRVYRLLDGLRVLQRFDGWTQAVARVVKRDETIQVECLLPASMVDVPSVVTVECRRFDQSGDEASDHALLIVRPSQAAHAGDRLEVSKRLTAIGKLATRVAHELNNPLDGIIRYVNLALRIIDDDAQPKVRTYLSESRTGLMRMVQIIGDLLEFSRNAETNLQQTSFNEVVDEAIRQTADHARRNQVVVASNYKSQEMPMVRGSRLYQVCTNLITNAIDAMPSGGRLTIMTGRSDDDVVLRVEDTGSGLPDDVDQVFEPFYTTKPAGKGTGLGLAICRDFIEDMGGRITAAHGGEGGAVFTVMLPVDVLDGPDQPGAPAQSGHADVSAPTAGEGMP